MRTLAKIDPVDFFPLAVDEMADLVLPPIPFDEEADLVGRRLPEACGTNLPELYTDCYAINCGGARRYFVS